MYKIMNSAMMPADGIYRRKTLNTVQFVNAVRSASATGLMESYIGYPQTAEFIEKLTDVPVEVSREPAEVEDGDTLIVCKLRYRPNADDKGKSIDENDFEFIEINYWSF